jgi:DNA-binding transcriptional MocR family regulator
MSQPMLHFSRGVPPPEAIPGAELADVTRAVLAEAGPGLFQYPPIGRYLGDPRLREQVADRHGADPDQVLVTGGSLQALDLLAADLLGAGCRPGAEPLVLVEAPSYDRAIRIFERHGARVVPIPLRADGIDVEELERRLREHRPAALYLIPDFQNPAGVTASEPNRRAVAALADRHRVPVVEDIPYRDLRFRGQEPPRLAELAEAVPVSTIGSLSKTLSPGLRIGWAITDPATAVRLAECSADTYLSPVRLTQAVAGRCLATGVVDRNVKQAREFLAPRHDAAVAAVRELLGPDALIAVPDGGYYVGVRLDVPAGEAAFVRAAGEAGVSVIPGSAFHPRSGPPDARLFLRLPFQALAPEQFRAGVAILAGLPR